MSKSNFDYSEFQAYCKNFEKMTKELEDFLKSFLLQMAQRVVSSVKQKTPVDTGAMRASWGIGSQKLALKSSIDEFGKESVSLDVDKSQVASIDVIGDTLEVVIWNGMEYSSFVEYGTSKKEGIFILTIAIDTVQKQIPARFQKEFADWLKNKGV